MNNKYLYTVAGHTFSVEIDSENPINGLMTNYIPFEETNCNTSQPIFTISICDKITLKKIIPIIIHHNKDSSSGNLDIYHTSDGYLLELFFPASNQLIGQLYISDNFRKAEITLHGSVHERYAIFDHSIMLCYLLATADKRTLLLHASTIIKNGYAYLFLGKSGTGKSTHSNLWQHYIKGVELLNDDHPAIRINNNGEVIIYGTPWSGKTPCYNNASAPIGSIVRIHQAKENHIKRLAPMEAYASLLPSSAGMSWEQELASGRDETLQQLIKSTSCWLLECLPNEAAVQLCATTINKKTA